VASHLGEAFKFWDCAAALITACSALLYTQMTSRCRIQSPRKANRLGLNTLLPILGKGSLDPLH